MEIPETITCQDIAKILGMSHTYVRDKLVHQPGFPKPVHWIQKPKRWLTEEFKKWMRV